MNELRERESTKILISEKFLQDKKMEIASLIKVVSETLFWQTHFSNHNFIFQLEKFTWDYWQKIPFFSVPDYQNIGLGSRLIDMKEFIMTNTSLFTIRVPYREMAIEPMVFLDMLSVNIQEKVESDLYIQCFDSSGLNLHHVLRSLSLESHPRIIITSPRKLEKQVALFVSEFENFSLFIDPSDFLLLIDMLSQKGIKKKLYNVIFSRSFKEKGILDKMRKIFPFTKFSIRYIFVDINSLIINCPEAKKIFGLNTVHPRKGVIIELRGMQPDGVGEVVVSSLDAKKISWIRYRTGLLGRALYRKCLCGEEWMLTLKPVKRYYFSPKITE